jgi:TonB-dependent SusC/RagA subfamily outer membrane receptor
MKKPLYTLAFIAGTLLWLSAGLITGPLPPIIPDLEKKLEDHFRRYPQQKAYLHLNKLAYRAGEDLWYKAYLVDARFHRPDSISSNLVVEIVNSFGQTSQIQMIKLEKGFAHGDFHLPDTLPEGLYQIRAYTNWMRNFDPEYFYRREFNVWNPGHYAQTFREDKLASKRHKRKSTRKAKKLDLQFFPEGGYMVSGHSTKLGFKAVNELGLGVEVSGAILDKKDQPVVDFQSAHLGMGAVRFTPEAGQKYTAEVHLGDGRKDRFRLPEVHSSGYTLKVVENDRNGLVIGAGSSIPGSSVLVAGHIRGNLMFTRELNIGDEPQTFQVHTADLPGGILHITLFDANRNPRCERLAFINSDDVIELAVRQQKQVYGKMEPVELELSAKDASGRPVAASFSLSVSDRDLENEASDFQSNIISNLMLTSDIRGRIEQPDFYFRDRNAETLEALDYLMLTQGWRRFNWDDIINGNALEINYPIQKGLVITGKITKQFLDLPLKNLPVTLTILSEFNDVFITRTDQDGRYKFELPDYEDTIQVEITARRLSGRKNLVIYLEDNDLEGADEIYSSYASEMVVKGTNVFKPMQEREVDTMQESLEGIYRTPDFVLEVDDNMRTYNSVFDMMQGRIPGVVVNGNSVQIRGPSTFYGSTEPLYLIDNVPTDAQAVAALNPNDVERIEVLKGPSAAIYGVRGANGVIAIFTRRGSYMIRGKLTFEMLGYHRPREFYSPKYGTEFDDLITDDRTGLYWNPNVRTDSTGKAMIRFYTSEVSSSFYVVAEGLTLEGKPGRAVSSFEVR